ncbi:hypothetical protein M3Y99_00571200 [Aphelenchoides fujianensis]|nr:hypothetical protein M3Y99_00571200 [Aphelenchoides fujianensis]
MDANNNTVKASRPPPGKDDFQKKVQLLFRMKTHGQRAELYPTLVDLLHWHMPSNDHSMETARRRLAIFREFVEYVEKATPEHMDKQYAALDAMSDEMIQSFFVVITNFRWYDKLAHFFANERMKQIMGSRVAKR